MLRHVLIGRFTLAELRRTLHPRGVLPAKLGKVVPENVMRGVIAVIWIGCLEVFTVLALMRPEVWTNCHWRGISRNTSGGIPVK